MIEKVELVDDLVSDLSLNRSWQMTREVLLSVSWKREGLELMNDEEGAAEGVENENRSERRERRRDLSSDFAVGAVLSCCSMERQYDEEEAVVELASWNVVKLTRKKRREERENVILRRCLVSICFLLQPAALPSYLLIVILHEDEWSLLDLRLGSSREKTVSR